MVQSDVRRWAGHGVLVVMFLLALVLAAMGQQTVVPFKDLSSDPTMPTGVAGLYWKDGAPAWRIGSGTVYDFASTPSLGLVVHVDQTLGDDAQSGTLVAPVATLEKAAELIGAMELATIMLGPGTYIYDPYDATYRIGMEYVEVEGDFVWQPDTSKNVTIVGVGRGVSIVQVEAVSANGAADFACSLADLSIETSGNIGTNLSTRFISGVEMTDASSAGSIVISSFTSEDLYISGLFSSGARALSVSGTDGNIADVESSNVLGLGCGVTTGVVDSVKYSGAGAFAVSGATIRNVSAMNASTVSIANFSEASSVFAKASDTAYLNPRSLAGETIVISDVHVSAGGGNTNIVNIRSNASDSFTIKHSSFVYTGIYGEGVDDGNVMVIFRTASAGTLTVENCTFTTTCSAIFNSHPVIGNDAARNTTDQPLILRNNTFRFIHAAENGPDDVAAAVHIYSRGLVISEGNTYDVDFSLATSTASARANEAAFYVSSSGTAGTSMIRSTGDVFRFVGNAGAASRGVVHVGTSPTSGSTVSTTFVNPTFIGSAYDYVVWGSLGATVVGNVSANVHPVTAQGTLTWSGGLQAAAMRVDNLNLDGNTVSSVDSNGLINLTPNGSGRVVLGNLTGPGLLYVDADEKVQILTGTGLLKLVDGVPTLVTGAAAGSVPVVDADGGVSAVEGGTGLQDLDASGFLSFTGGVFTHTE